MKSKLFQFLKKDKTSSVLLLGRADCEATDKVLNLLKTLKCDITFIRSITRGENLPDSIKNWHGDFIFSFRSLFILPKHLLNNARVAAINFHPAPVEYPGSGCVNFALYDDAKEYGVTAHIMTEKIDGGPILDCKRFAIYPEDTVKTLLERTHLKLQDLFFEVAPRLIKGGESQLTEMLSKCSQEKWRGSARMIKELDELRTIPTNINAAELKRIIRATYTDKFPPIIQLHGYEFILKISNKVKL